MKTGNCLLLAGMLSIVLLAGCENTIQGFGQDMQNAGKKIQSSTDNPPCKSGDTNCKQ